MSARERVHDYARARARGYNEARRAAAAERAKRLLRCRAPLLRDDDASIMRIVAMMSDGALLLIYV